MTSRDDFHRLPPRVDPSQMIEEEPPYQAVEQVRGARQVSPLSPVAGIDEARLYASIATDPHAQPWRRRLARGMALYLLLSIFLAVFLGTIVNLVGL